MLISDAKRPAPIALSEVYQRLNKLRHLMEKERIDAVVLGASKSLNYFTSINWSPSERFTGVVVFLDGTILYVCPQFERERLESKIVVHGDIVCWEEDENPYHLLKKSIAPRSRVGLDTDIPVFTFFGLRRALADCSIAPASDLIVKLRSKKSTAEIALLAHAKTITLEVQRRTWRILKVGIYTSEIKQFIDSEHRALGADNGSSFCLVAFGKDTALPHGGNGDKRLEADDVVLIDTGCQIGGYNSDVTRTYVFGEPTQLMRAMWDLEKQAQAAAFALAQIGTPCEAVDAAARSVVERVGLGPNYALPGIPHRTGHGIGLDLHESPNLVRGERTLLEAGMCFSIEPTIVLPNEFGVRLEDHIYMTEDGPEWFTRPSQSIDSPFE